MLAPLAVVVYVLAAALGALAVHRGLRDRVIDDPMIISAGLLLVVLVVQAVICSVHAGQVKGSDSEPATFVAYAVTLPLVVPAVIVLALKERSRWAMWAIAIACFAVLVMTARLQQIWSLSA